jgi:hypothetical protein
MENIHKIIPPFQSFLVPMLRPPVHKILRNRKLAGFMYFSFSSNHFFLQWNIDLSEMTNRASFMVFYPIIYLVIIKKF